MIAHEPVQIVAGYKHTMILMNDMIYVWGKNKYGQLGLGDNDDRDSPCKLLLPSDIKLISCGGDHTIAVLLSKRTYVWGENELGQLGLGDNDNRNSPSELSLPSDIKLLSCGGAHTIAVLFSNKTYVWGSNYYGQLGLGDQIHQNTPQDLMLNNVESISCGCNHTIAMTADGEIYVWGMNDDGRLGLGDTNKRCSPTKLSFANVSIKSIVCGGYHTIALTSDNKIYSWGCNGAGQLGLNDHDQRYRSRPCLVDLNNVKLVSCGGYHTMAVVQDNMSEDLSSKVKVYVWGNNDNGQLGLGDNIDIFYPQELILTNISMITCGSYHTIAKTNTNDIYVWGWSPNGNINTPCQLKF